VDQKSSQVVELALYVCNENRQLEVTRCLLLAASSTVHRVGEVDERLR
jgi:hypothetical protein